MTLHDIIFRALMRRVVSVRRPENLAIADGPRVKVVMRRWWVLPYNRLLNISLHQAIASGARDVLPGASGALVWHLSGRCLFGKSSTRAAMRFAMPGDFAICKYPFAPKLRLLGDNSSLPGVMVERPAWFLAVSRPRRQAPAVSPRVAA